MTCNDGRIRQSMTEAGLTKSEQTNIADVSSGIIAKMGKSELVRTQSQSGNPNARQCGIGDFDDALGNMQSKLSEIEQYGISEATKRNWKKLNAVMSDRLTSRANKRKSSKRVFPQEYMCNKNNIAFIADFLDYIDERRLDIASVIYSLGINLLKKAGICNKPHVAATLSEYGNIPVIEELTAMSLPTDEFDILGLIYQSYMHEGKKNIIGSYYTPKEIARNMVKNFDFSNGQTFFDPCCGSGVFFLCVSANNPNQICGADNDGSAVLISKINMLLKYREFEFTPRVYCLDYLMGALLAKRHPELNEKFDYIATNPPWGAMGKVCEDLGAITSKETFSYFFVKAFRQLKENGIIKFLFPEAILNVKIHKDIRDFIVNTAGLASITAYEDYFSGVTTKYVDIECGKHASKSTFLFCSGDKHKSIDIRTIYETDNLAFRLLSEEDVSVIRIFKEKGCYSLENSTWGLGIVTGDNKGKLHCEYMPGMERIYTGKDIQPYSLQPAKHYILYDRAKLQQVAKEEIYRAPEKLVYKFISDKLVFAYDDSGSLFLNSANILIPNIPAMSIKTAMAFLNSALFRYMYIKLFGEIKVLKGNLIELRFPKITSNENKELTALADDVLKGNGAVRYVIDDYVFSLYGLSENQKEYIRSATNGTTRKRIKNRNLAHE